MKTVLRVGVVTLALVVLWAAVAFVWTSDGWGKRTLAPRGDAAGFMDAAVTYVDSRNRGNAVFVLITDGTVHGVHAVSVGEAVDVNTVFQTASLSKWITAWGVMALVQEGKLDLDAPVSTHLTRWALPESTFDNGKVTARRLLSHTAGLSEFEGFMRRVIFRPLGMVRSSYSWTPEEGVTLATFYDADSRPATHYRFSAVAAASLYTSVSDLTRFLQAHLPGENGEPIGRGVLAPALVREMWRPHASRFGEDIWGLGTMLYAGNNQGGFIVGHDGNNEPAINTAARLYPATGNGIVILETGTPLLATQLASEWVYWETGNVDFLAFTMGIPGMLRLMMFGSVAIVLVVPAVAWSIRRRRQTRIGAALTASGILAGRLRRRYIAIRLRGTQHVEDTE